MDENKLKILVENANRDLTSTFRNRDVDAMGKTLSGGTPRFELYHAGPSLCSQKVRATLAEKGLPFRSHDINLMANGNFIPENYRPGYVRLRMAGAPDSPLATGYTGRSSVDSEGFDPAVVPTLVDHKLGRIVVDSVRICDYVDREEGQMPNLRPANLSEEIDEMIAIVDSAPHVALLYGANPLGDHRPAMLAKMIAGVHARKEVAIRKVMANIADDPELIAAYESKISKEQAAARFIGDPVSMASIVGQMKEGVDQLEQQLAKREGDWVCGDVFTLADVVWAPSLFRMRAMGIGHLFDAGGSCPRVAAHAERLFSRKTFRAAVVDWPGSNPPTEHIPELNTLGFKLRFMWTLLRGRL